MSLTHTTSRLSKFSESETSKDGAVPYFPPPPGTASEPETKKSPRRPKPAPLPLHVKESTTRPQRRSSLRHTTGFPSQSRKKRLQEVHLPAIKLSPRHWILVTLLILSFAILMMGFIFADCVALPHTNREDGTTTDDIDTDSITLYIRQVDSDPASQPVRALGNGGESNRAADVNSSSTQNGTDGPTTLLPASLSGAGTPPQTNTTTPSEYLANESKRMGFDSPKNLAILFFYTATLPLLTILHAVTEMIILCCAKRTSSSSSTDSDLKPTPSRPSKLTSLIPFLPAISLTMSLLLTGGWIAINTIQFHCEIHSSSPTPSNTTDTTSLLSVTNQQICPVQTRGHFMHGIRELSLAKNVLGWVLVAVYIGYAAWCVRVNGLVWKRAVQARKARKMSVEVVSFGIDEKKGSVRVTVQEA